MEDNSDKKIYFEGLKKFASDLRTFLNTHVAYNQVVDAEKAVLDDNGPLAEICNKYTSDGTLDKTERRFKAYYIGECEIPHAEIEILYLSKAYGYWKNLLFTV